ncbi:Threonyl-tRNA synthetase [Methanonatronarchaeum thermophilum]|uniref:Threonine--tRNA ligase n=1 Tax=Methanonatronarchaeum thermophilum TaxID=1927129 RepID=A0A1Y3GCZ0_9EURY|nr:threonine--tRNA ligase [Methanonatronarchaeum thermophilum]OUJ18183.1 Threonyl-tRNA synthetase [Methanonatronarchaeum thermophilum]
MKLLLIHSDHFKYKVTKETPVAEDISDELKEGLMDEVLAVFTTVEQTDEENPENIVKQAKKEIIDVLESVNAERVMLYPYAHLSPDLGSPETAVKILKQLEKELQNSNIETQRSPFGWYKAFEVSCKGHPLSELSRDIKPETKEKEETGEEKRAVPSEYLILYPDGTEEKINPTNYEKNDVENKPLNRYILSEEVKGQPSEKPPSIDSMRKLEIADYEPSSDPGNLKFYPKGSLIFNLMKDWAHEIAVDRFGAMEIDTPILYDWNEPDIREQGESFHERHYIVSPPEGDKELVLRFAGDFGLFKMLQDSIISYRDLPIRIYEFSKSFRYEKRGELSGLKRLRAFHMPDIHSFTANLESGWKEYQELYKEYAELADGTNIEYAVVFRVVEEFYRENKQKITELLQYSDKPAYIELLKERKHYWVVKHEFQGIDSTGGNSQLSTVQLDIEDAERYGITYTDQDGQEKGCIICHSSIGSIERWIYEIIENAHKMDKPTLPTWLCPTQTRILPISSDNTEYAEKIQQKLTKNNIRADIDDTDSSLGKKIRNAEMEWIPYIIVVGDREQQNQEINLRTRKTGKEKTTKLNQLIKEIKEETKQMPHRPLPLPKKLSKRPKFIG